MKDDELPPRPGEEKQKKEIKGVPVVIYINGAPFEMSKREAFGVMQQLINIFCYLQDIEDEKVNDKI